MLSILNIIFVYTSASCGFECAEKSVIIRIVLWHFRDMGFSFKIYIIHIVLNEMIIEFCIRNISNGILDAFEKSIRIIICVFVLHRWNFKHFPLHIQICVLTRECAQRAHVSKTTFMGPNPFHNIVYTICI